MENQDSLQAQVQAVISGELTGEQARRVLQLAAMDALTAQRTADAKARLLAAAETAVLYGPGGRRADHVDLLKQALQVSFAGFPSPAQ